MMVDLLGFNRGCGHSCPRFAPHHPSPRPMPHHADRPTKICPVCQRPFQWRKKWKDVWQEVRYCSERCRREARRLSNRAKP